MATETKKMHEAVAERIISRLKEGTALWQLPWEQSHNAYIRPYNAVTNQSYRGLNSLYLQMFSPFDDPRWATFKQVQSRGWQVQKGAKGMSINFVKTHEYYPKRDEAGKPVLDPNGNPVHVRRGPSGKKAPVELFSEGPVRRAGTIVTKAWVFNAQQIQGVPPMEKLELASQWEKLNRVENLVNNTKASIENIPGNQAYYSPLRDIIRLPERSQFKTSDRYYSTLLHELGHWTGHKDRLDRSIINTFGTQEYAREELRAEIASMMMGSELRIGHDPDHHVAYVDSWIKILTEKPFEIHQAAADSQKIMDFLMTFDRKRELNPQENLETISNGEEKKVPEIELEPLLKTGR